MIKELIVKLFIINLWLILYWVMSLLLQIYNWDYLDLWIFWSFIFVIIISILISIVISIFYFILIKSLLKIEFNNIILFILTFFIWLFTEYIPYSFLNNFNEYISMNVLTFWYYEIM